MKNLLLMTTFLCVTLIDAKSQSPTVLLEAHNHENKVELNWNSTLSTKGGYFIVQRSQDAKNWEELLTLRCKGEGDELIDYFELDNTPLKGSSFYRLKHVTYAGDINYSNVVPVCHNSDLQVSNVYSLTEDKISCDNSDKPWIGGGIYFVVLRDRIGNEYYCKAHITESNGSIVAEPIEAILPEGTYLVIASNNNNLYSHQLAVMK